MSAPSFRTALVVPLLALSSLALAACGSVSSAGDPSVANPLDSDESDAIFQLNTIREAKGLPAVTDCYTLNISASAHSDDMRDNPTLPLGTKGSDGSTLQTRACDAGYKVACSGTPRMGEVVAFGYNTGADDVTGWSTDPNAGPIVLDPTMKVVGAGRSQGSMGYYYTMDFGSEDDPSCAMQ
jgi:uncharacterized protein YkwD